MLVRKIRRHLLLEVMVFQPRISLTPERQYYELNCNSYKEINTLRIHNCMRNLSFATMTGYYFEVKVEILQLDIDTDRDNLCFQCIALCLLIRFTITIRTQLATLPLLMFRKGKRNLY